jgi:hypothetical protein
VIPDNGSILIDLRAQFDMKRTLHKRPRLATERGALRRRVQQFYRHFNEADWETCHNLIDPQLTEHNKVDRDAYFDLMEAFRSAYGSVNLWLTRLSLHVDASSHQRDKRPFAYAYVIWQDDSHGFHMFRERWVKENGHWFTRVVGLVPNQVGKAIR